MGRFLALDGKGDTSEETLALKDASGEPGS